MEQLNVEVVQMNDLFVEMKLVITDAGMKSH
jgi:hypothetical protein